MSQEMLSGIAAITGLVAAIGSLFASFAAWRSARNSGKAVTQVQAVEHRVLFRDVVTTAESIIAEGLQVDDLANSLKREYRTLSDFTGQVRDSRIEVQIKSIARQQQEVEPLQCEARERLEGRESLRAMGEEDLFMLLTKFEGHVIHIRRIKERLSRDLASAEQQNRQLREHEMSKARDESRYRF